MTDPWASYFLTIADSIAANSKCHSRMIGALLVRDRIIISTGYNGPPRGASHCKGCCPRQTAGYKSGEALEVCPATHAEQNCIASAAYVGASTKGSALYLNTVAPCKWCMGLLINAGVSMVITSQPGWYDDMARRLAFEAGLIVSYKGIEVLR